MPPTSTDCDELSSDYDMHAVQSDKDDGDNNTQAGTTRRQPGMNTKLKKVCRFRMGIVAPSQ
jgi:hypothetical protein